MRLHQTMVKPQEVEAIGAIPEVYDPGLVRVQTQLECLGCSLEPSVGALRVGLGPTQDHTIIRVTDDAPEVSCLLRPEDVEGIAVDIAQERRYRSALRNAGRGGDGHTVLHHARAHPLPDQPEHPTIADPPSHQTHQKVWIETPVEVPEVDLHHPPGPRVDLLPNALQRLVG